MPSFINKSSTISRVPEPRPVTEMAGRRRPPPLDRAAASAGGAGAARLPSRCHWLGPPPPLDRAAASAGGAGAARLPSRCHWLERAAVLGSRRGQRGRRAAPLACPRGVTGSAGRRPWSAPRPARAERAPLACPRGVTGSSGQPSLDRAAASAGGGRRRSPALAVSLARAGSRHRWRPPATHVIGLRDKVEQVADNAHMHR